MSRTQIFTPNAQKTIALAVTPEQVITTQTFVKSFFIQAAVTNTDYVYVGDVNNQNISLGPGQNVQIDADALDLGGGGKLDLSLVYVRTAVNGGKVNWAYLAGI